MSLAYRFAIAGYVQLIAVFWHAGRRQTKERAVTVAADRANQFATLIDWLVPSVNAAPPYLTAYHVVRIGLGQLETGAKRRVMVTPGVDGRTVYTRDLRRLFQDAALGEGRQECGLRLGAFLLGEALAAPASLRCARRARRRGCGGMGSGHTFRRRLIRRSCVMHGHAIRSFHSQSRCAPILGDDEEARLGDESGN